jgi:hypothetical protein
VRRVVLALGVLASVEALYLLLELRGIGFPDGHRTQLDRFREAAYPLFAASLFALALGAMYVGVGRAGAPPGRAMKAVLFVSIALHVVLGVISFLAAVRLDHGAGG